MEAIPMKDIRVVMPCHHHATFEEVCGKNTLPSPHVIDSNGRSALHDTGIHPTLNTDTKSDTTTFMDSHSLTLDTVAHINENTLIKVDKTDPAHSHCRTLGTDPPYVPALLGAGLDHPLETAPLEGANWTILP